MGPHLDRTPAFHLNLDLLSDSLGSHLLVSLPNVATWGLLRLVAKWLSVAARAQALTPAQITRPVNFLGENLHGTSLQLESVYLPIVILHQAFLQMCMPVPGTHGGLALGLPRKLQGCSEVSRGMCKVRRTHTSFRALKVISH